MLIFTCMIFCTSCMHMFVCAQGRPQSSYLRRPVKSFQSNASLQICHIFQDNRKGVLYLINSSISGVNLAKKQFINSKRTLDFLVET